MTARPCDFCCTGQPAAVAFTTEPFTWHTLGDENARYQAGDNWSACRHCTVLMLGRRWPQLADRAVATFLRRRPQYEHLAGAVREDTLALHQRFDSARTGAMISIPAGGQ